MNETEPIGLAPIPEADVPKTPRKRFPLVFLIFYLFFALSAVLFLACLFSPALADGVNRTVSAAIRACLAYLTNWIPFSFAEFLLLLLPALLVVLILYGVKKHADSWRDVARYALCLLSVLALVGGIFLSAFAPGYHGRTLDEKLGLDKQEVSTAELYETAYLLLSAMDEELDELSFTTDGFSVMPYDLAEMNRLLLDGFDKVSADYDVVSRLKSRVKPVMISRAMSYTHITGVYTFFTGEANLNVDFPDYTLPYTAAHELAHQRGIAREDEANFVAFLVCAASEDAYIRYCGYRNLFDHVISALYEADPMKYSSLISYAPRPILREMRAYSQFFDQYRDSIAADVSEVVNNTYLTMQGTEGTRSYGMVVDLAVAYFKTAETP